MRYRRLFGIFSGIVRRLRPSRPAGTAPTTERFLFLQYDQPLGSAVLATPVFTALKAARPHCTIAVASAGLSYRILHQNPAIDLIVETPDPHQRPVAATWTILRQFRRVAAFDAVLTSVGNMKTRIAGLAALAPAHRRLGFTAAPELYDVALAVDSAIGIIENNLRLLSLLGIESPRPPLPVTPEIWFTVRDQNSVAALLAGAGIGPDDRLAVIATQTSGGHPSSWYNDRFATVADHLSSRHGSAIAFVGTAKERAAIDDIRRMMTRASVNLAGATGISDLSALFCRADWAVTLDTGTMHAARAAAVPMVIIGHAANPAYEWLPLGVPSARIVRRNDIGCRECRKSFCATHECMDEIGSSEVAAAIDELVARFPASPAERERRLSRCRR